MLKASYCTAHCTAFLGEREQTRNIMRARVKQGGTVAGKVFQLIDQSDLNQQDVYQLAAIQIESSLLSLPGCGTAQHIKDQDPLLCVNDSWHHHVVTRQNGRFTVLVNDKTQQDRHSVGSDTASADQQHERECDKETGVA